MKNLIRLICLSLILLTTYATAQITIDGETIHVETNNYKVQFRYGMITYLHNKFTAEIYTLPLEPIFETYPAILGTNKNFRSPRARTVKTYKINDNTVESIFQRDGNQIKLVITIDPHTDDLLISGDCIADTPGVYAIQQWGIDNLNPNLRLLAPSEKIQLIDANFTRDYRGFVYPSTSWEAQLAIIEAQNGGFYVQSTDTTFRFKTMVYENHTDKFSLRFRTQNQAPWDNLTTATSVTWKFNTYAGDWCVPAQLYRDWMEQAFDPWKLADMPAWVSEINLVVIHSNLNAELLPNLAKVADSTKTLLYLTDWREEGHDINHPDYSNPHENFVDFLEVADRYGFRVMLHVNIYNCSPTHPLFPEFERYQYRFPWNGELSGHRWDEIGHPQRNAHINPASSEWRKLLVQEFKAVWEKYNIDAFHLDVSSYILNDLNGLIEGLTSAQGNVLMHLELAQAMSGAVFSGEGLHEVSFFRENFAQRRGKIIGDSHPLTAFLFSPYTRFYGGLDTPAGADSHDYQLFLKNAQTQGYIPTHWINKTEMLDIPLIQQVVSDAHQWEPIAIDCHSTYLESLQISSNPNPDINRDGQVNVLDLILVTQKFGQKVSVGSMEDLNRDGAVNLLDLVFVAEHLSQNAAAPSQLAFIESIPSTAKEVIAAQRALTELEAIPNRTPRIQIAIELLRHYLAVADRNVKETKLLPNYPNPFNPDTWIPYQLSEASTVTLKIYDIRGHLVRTIQVGHKPIGYYLTRERAIYWDGRNQNREPVSSGVYFYTLNTDTHTQTRRMVIVK